MLPEGLRTLVVSPGRVVEPGQTVHATFTFRNLGGGAATGFRARFRLPEGLTYLVGTASIDGAPLDERGGLTTLLQSSGADIGDIPAGGERRVALAYTVAPTIENGTDHTAGGDLVVRGPADRVERPAAGRAQQARAAECAHEAHRHRGARDGARPGAAAQGAGPQLRPEQCAHDLIVLLPVPANTYVDDSARVAGHASGGPGQDPFGFGRPSITVPMLGPGTTLDVATA